MTSGTVQQEVSVKRHFEAHSCEWESIYGRRDQHALTIRKRHDTAIRFVMSLRLAPGARILDLGCGAGITVAALAERGFNVLGIDVSDHMLDRARKNCALRGLSDHVSFRVGDAEALDLPDEAFDVVIAMGLIEYLRRDRWALQEMGRVLKPGGHLIVTVPNRDRLAFRIGRVASKIEDRFAYYRSRVRTLAGLRHNGSAGSPPRDGSKDSEGFTRRLYSPAGLREQLGNLDYEIVESMSHGFGPFGPLSRSRTLSVLADRTLELGRDQLRIPLLAEAGSNYMVLCRKPASQDLFERGDAAVRLDGRIAQFELDEKQMFVRREAWLGQHPSYAPTVARELDPRHERLGRVLVLAPHPDDEIIGCGGTLSRLIEAGSSVSVLHLTDGAATSALDGAPEAARRTIRLREAELVADEMGFADTISWGDRQEDFVCDAGRVAELRAVLERTTPDLVFVPFINDPHHDHLTANRLLAAALAAGFTGCEPRIVGYEVWSLVPTNLVCTIDEQWRTKSRMLLRYRTAMKTVNYVGRCRVQAGYHARTLLGKRGLAEAFFELSAAAYIALVGGLKEERANASGASMETEFAK